MNFIYFKLFCTYVMW